MKNAGSDLAFLMICSIKPTRNLLDFSAVGLKSPENATRQEKEDLALAHRVGIDGAG